MAFGVSLPCPAAEKQERVRGASRRRGGEKTQLGEPQKWGMGWGDRLVRPPPKILGICPVQCKEELEFRLSVSELGHGVAKRGN